MTFKFFLPKKVAFQNIYLKITDVSRNIDFQFQTPLSISENEWNVEKQRPNNIYLKKYKQINEKIDHLKLELAEYIKEKDASGKTLTQKALSKKTSQICNESPKQITNSLLNYTHTYISAKENLISHSTFKRYKVFLKLLQRFEGCTMQRLYIDTINSNFVNDFIMFGKEEKYSNNTIYRTIHFVKTILNFAERKGIRTCVREIQVKREKQNKEVITLCEKELRRIKDTEVSVLLQSAKDWLLISCYTGQRFSDFINFSTKQLLTIDGKICIKFVQQKTQKLITLPLHPVVLNILRGNNNQFPDAMSIQRYNNQIKEIAKKAKLNEPVWAKKRLGFRSQKIETEKWKTISSHVGRRSFATNFYGKIPTPLLMEATGHGTEKMFLHYINPINKDRILSLGEYFDRAYNDELAAV